MSQSVYVIVTQRILESIRQGVTPWVQPWRRQGLRPVNIATKRPYRGFNAMVLGLSEFDSPYFGTYAQITELGGQVRKGERGIPVFFAKTEILQDPASKVGESESAKERKIVRYYRVFNASQCDGLEFPVVSPKQPESLMLQHTEKLEQVADILSRYQGAPEISYGGNSAFYRPNQDRIQLPSEERFFTRADFACTLFHELIHSTGHKSRLNRKGISEWNGFGSHEYTCEELVAEMGAAFLCAEANLLGQVPQSASYLSGWLSKLENNPQWLIVAAAQAEKAVDFVLGREAEAYAA